MTSSRYSLEPLANYHCACGENPLWDDRRGVLFWEDIPAGRIFRYDPRTGEHGQVHAGEVVGGFEGGAVAAAEDLACNVFIPWGWGTWIISYEHLLEPVRRLQYAWDQMQPENMQLQSLKMGETYTEKAIIK